MRALDQGFFESRYLRACLLSGLAHHELTTQIPHAVHLALERGSERPRLEYPPLEVYWFAPAFRAGIEEVALDGVVFKGRLLLRA